MWISLAVAGKCASTGARLVVTCAAKPALVCGDGKFRDEGAKMCVHVGARMEMRSVVESLVKPDKKDVARVWRESWVGDMMAGLVMMEKYIGIDFTLQYWFR
jgi:hypothetical protein